MQGLPIAYTIIGLLLGSTALGLGIWYYFFVKKYHKKGTKKVVS
jgi:NO-binding membrane sensor protein with MHYT domain